MGDNDLSVRLEEIVLQLQLDACTPRQYSNSFPTFIRKEKEILLPLMCLEILDTDADIYCSNIEKEMRKFMNMYKISFRSVKVTFHSTEQIHKMPELTDFPTTGIRYMFIVHIK